MPVMHAAHDGWIIVNPVLLNPNSKLAVVLSWLPWSSPIIMPMRMGLTTVSPLSDRRLDRSSRFSARVGAVWLVGADLSRRNADVRQEAELRGSGEVDPIRVTSWHRDADRDPRASVASRRR